MRNEARAFAPSHITGFFQIFPNGSTGAGLNTAVGATTLVRFSPAAQGSVLVRINGEESPAPVSRGVVAKFSDRLPLGALEIEHEIGYPIGYGMGMSGAGAFSLALALNELLGGGRSSTACMELAVAAEIESGTGLGDVVAQQFHGIMIGLEPYPSRTVEIIPSEAHWVVCAFFEPLETKKIIRDETWKALINRTGAECMSELMKDKTVANFMHLSRRFTLETGLANETVRRVLEAVPESSMAMLGQTAFAITDDPERIKQRFSEFTHDINISALAEHGAKVL